MTEKESLAITSTLVREKNKTSHSWLFLANQKSFSMMRKVPYLQTQRVNPSLDVNLLYLIKVILNRKNVSVFGF